MIEYVSDTLRIKDGIPQGLCKKCGWMRYYFYNTVALCLDCNQSLPEAKKMENKFTESREEICRRHLRVVAERAKDLGRAYSELDMRRKKGWSLCEIHGNRCAFELLQVITKPPVDMSGYEDAMMKVIAREILEVGRLDATGSDVT